jgi:phage terminase Nu1 subunit (DNA packaging protein)
LPDLLDLSAQVTQQRFGEVVGVSHQAVSDALRRGVLPENGTSGAWLLAYCGHLREAAAGRATNGDLDLASERAALAKAQREKIEMQNAVTRGELAPVALLEQVLTATASRVAGILDAIPGMVRRRVPQLSADDIVLVAEEVARARNTVAGMRLVDVDVELDDDVREDAVDV